MKLVTGRLITSTDGYSRYEIDSKDVEPHMPDGAVIDVPSIIKAGTMEDERKRVEAEIVSWIRSLNTMPLAEWTRDYIAKGIENGDYRALRTLRR